MGTAIPKPKPPENTGKRSEKHNNLLKTKRIVNAENTGLVVARFLHLACQVGVSHVTICTIQQTQYAACVL